MELHIMGNTLIAEDLSGNRFHAWIDSNNELKAKDRFNLSQVKKAIAQTNKK